MHGGGGGGEAAYTWSNTSVNPMSTGGCVFHLQPSKCLRTSKRSKPLP